MEYVYYDTKIIRLSDLAYPKNYANLIFEFPNTSFSYPLLTSTLEDFGYAYVYESEKPVGDVVTEGQPILGSDGKYYKSYNVRSFTPEEVAFNLQSDKDQLIYNSYYVYTANLEDGFYWEHQGNTHNFKISVANWSIWNNLYWAQANTEDEKFLLRTQENVILKLSKEDFLVFYSLANSEYKTLRDAYFNFVDEVQAVVTKEELPEKPSTFREV